MNKKLLAAAIAATVIAAPAAFAESTVYGKIHTSIDGVDVDGGVDNYQVNGRSSRLGFKGSEDLGNGLKAIYQIELGFNSDGGGTGQSGAASGLGSASRNTFVGLAGGFGTFLVGRHDTPMKMAFYAAGNERLGDSIIDLNNSSSLTPSASKGNKQPIGVFAEHRVSNAIAYVSPSFGGLTVVGAVMPGENGGGVEGDSIADHMSLGVMFKGAGLKAGLGYQETELDNLPGSGTQETLQLGGSYGFGAFNVGAQFEDTSNFAFVSGADYQAWALTAKATFGNNAVSLVYTDSELDVAGGQRDTQGWGIAGEHNFSKRTKVYAAYAADERDFPAGTADQDVDVFSIGMIHNF